MQPIVYLFFDGACDAAMRFYGQVFGTEPEILGLDSAPAEVRASLPGASGVMHSAVQVGSGWIYAADDMSGDAVAAMQGCSISVSLPDEAEARRVFDALSEGGTVRMPMAPMFFSPAFGTLTDRFGTRWMVMTDMVRG